MNWRWMIIDLFVSNYNKPLALLFPTWTVIVRKTFIFGYRYGAEDDAQIQVTVGVSYQIDRRIWNGRLIGQ